LCLLNIRAAVMYFTLHHDCHRGRGRRGRPERSLQMANMTSASATRECSLFTLSDRQSLVRHDSGTRSADHPRPAGGVGNAVTAACSLSTRILYTPASYCTSRHYMLAIRTISIASRPAISASAARRLHSGPSPNTAQLSRHPHSSANATFVRFLTASAARMSARATKEQLAALAEFGACDVRSPVAEEASRS
jgi:hypothetical protein